MDFPLSLVFELERNHLNHLELGLKPEKSAKILKMWYLLFSQEML